MRIALNAQLLSRARSYRSGGINRHIYHLLAELARDGRRHAYDVYLPGRPHDHPSLAQSGLQLHPTGPLTERPIVRIAWEQALLPLQLRRMAPDLLHSLAYVSPVAWNGPTVLTMYDLSFLRFPDAFRPGNRLYLGVMARLSARRARRVITISESSRSDIVRLLGVPANEVEVTYLAADERYRPLPADEVARFRRERDLPERFIFYLGTLEPRKNLTGLLEAYALLPPPRPPLYVAGAAGWRFTPVFSTVRALKLERDVHFLGFVPEDDLPLWYNAARLFAYPSLYEGFGLPVLEAMACGTPVITSNVSSLPEVAGQAAVLVSPTDPPRLTQEMQRLVDDSEHHRSLRAAGLIQASRFSWATTADRTVQAYERASGTSHR